MRPLLRTAPGIVKLEYAALLSEFITNSTRPLLRINSNKLNLKYREPTYAGFRIYNKLHTPTTWHKFVGTFDEHGLA